MNNEQFTLCAQQYIDTVFRVALSYIGNPTDADDITQNVFLKLLREERSFESQEHIRNWLIRVAINECKNLVRSRRWKHESLEACRNAFAFDSPERSELFYAVMALPKRYRMPIYLYYYEGYSTQEAADILGTTKNTVCTQLRRGREQLKRSLMEVEDHV